MFCNPYNYMKRLDFLQVLLGAAFVFLLSFQGVSAKEPTMSPEPSTPVAAGKGAQGSRYMIVTSHPEATKAGEYVLKAGGGAVDAAVAVQLVLGLVEPQSS